MKTKLIQITVPIELRQRLGELAKLDKRSMSAEALVILESEVNRRLGELRAIKAGQTQIDMAAMEALR